MFFTDLLGLSPNLDLTLHFMRKGEKVTVSVLPATADEIKPLTVTGTVAELDEGFMDAIRQPLALVNGLTSNAAEFEASVKKAPDKATTPKTKAADKKTPAAMTEQPAAQEQKPDVVFTEDLEAQVNACASGDELTALAKSHSQRFDTEPALQEAYNARRKEIDQTAAAIAESASAEPAKPSPPKPAPPRPAAVA